MIQLQLLGRSVSGALCYVLEQGSETNPEESMGSLSVQGLDDISVARLSCYNFLP